MKIKNEALVSQAAERFDLEPAACHYLGGEDGDVYEVRQGNTAFILKLVPTTEEGILVLSEKIDFAHFLSDHGIRLARWLPSLHDCLVEVIRSGEMVITVTKMEKVAGKHPDTRDPREWNAALFAQWGRVMGRMHHITQQYTAGNHIGHWSAEVSSFIDWCSDPEVKPHWLSMEAWLKTLPRLQDAYGLIHNDLHQWNFMLNQGAITIFDFDVCNHHWFATDIGIALFHGLWVDSLDKSQSIQDRNQKFYDSFVEGYAAENHLDRAWWDHLPHFLKYRQLLSYTVFSDPGSAAHADARQRRWVAAMRRGIVDNIPVLDLDF